jgi:eukaryotic-like serine/threonine-protein kinase
VEKRCVGCDAWVPVGAAFCPSCGKAVSGTPASIRQSTSGVTMSAPPVSLHRPSGAASRFPPGAVLADRYRIVSLLGRGGMGEVYRADDLKLGQTVALKFLPRQVVANEQVRRRLYQEVRLGRQVSHPNVCRLYDVVEWDEHLFVAMEYIDGEDLASLLVRVGTLPAPKMLQLAHEICAGLSAAHGLGVLHRDLKPANIMIDGRGHARITDFGIAVLAEEAPAHLEIAGTLAYMAPEQLRGEPASIRTDLYALGLVLYEMLAGRRLFNADSPPEVLRQRDRTDPGGLVVAAQGHPTLKRAIARCLEARPEDRPASIHAMIAALRPATRCRRRSTPARRLRPSSWRPRKAPASSNREGSPCACWPTWRSSCR